MKRSIAAPHRAFGNPNPAVVFGNGILACVKNETRSTAEGLSVRHACRAGFNMTAWMMITILLVFVLEFGANYSGETRGIC